MTPIFPQINSEALGSGLAPCGELFRRQVLAAWRDDCLTHTTPLHRSTSEGRGNPTVYHYTARRLNTKPGERMTEWCVHVSSEHACLCAAACFLLFVCVMSACVHPRVRVWACSASSACVSDTTRLWWTTLDVCESLLAEHNAEQPRLPLQLETKQKKKVTARRPLWNTRCSFGKSRQLGCLHFSDWEGKKTRCPPWAAQQQRP